jgi:hypothetical protein
MRKALESKLQDGLGLTAAESVSSTLPLNLSDSYCLVSKAEIKKLKDDVKSSTSTPPMAIQPSVTSIGRSLLSGRARTGPKMKLNNLRTKICVGLSSSSAAAAANAAVFNIDPSVSSEYASFTNLYDEIIVHGGEFDFRLSSTGGAPTFTTGALAYDPTDTSTYGSVEGVLVGSQKYGPFMALSSTGVAGVLFDPEPVNQTGFWKLKFRCPTGGSKIASATAADQEIVTGMWASCNGSVNPKWGFIKAYVAAAGATVVLTISGYLTMDCEFRSRT